MRGIPIRRRKPPPAVIDQDSSDAELITAVAPALVAAGIPLAPISPWSPPGTPEGDLAHLGWLAMLPLILLGLALAGRDVKK